MRVDILMGCSCNLPAGQIDSSLADARHVPGRQLLQVGSEAASVYDPRVSAGLERLHMTQHTQRSTQTDLITGEIHRAWPSLEPELLPI